jgi:hypothetical protein
VIILANHLSVHHSMIIASAWGSFGEMSST